MYRDPWPSLGDMYPDACPGCANMGRRIGWDSDGSITEELCECEKGTSYVKEEIWQPVEGIDFENFNRDVLEVITVEGTHVAMSHTDHGVTVYPLPENLRLCQRVEPEAIAPDALRREPGWEYMQWNGVTDEWYKQFSPPIMGHSNCVGVRFRERKSVPPDEPTVYIFLSNSYVHATGVKTMADLRTLVRMLGGAA